MKKQIVQFILEHPDCTEHTICSLFGVEALLIVNELQIRGHLHIDENGFYKPEKTLRL